MPKKSPIPSILFGVGLVGLTAGVIYLGVRSGRKLQEAQAAYLALPVRDRFIGMLYLWAERATSAAGRAYEEVPQLGTSNPAAIATMQLFSSTSPADRAEFWERAFGLPYEVDPLERSFKASEVRDVAAYLSARDIPFSSQQALAAISTEFPQLAAKLGLARS